MKKRALKKDFHMEIKKSLNRFLSIFFIVAMGVAFFSGIQSSAPDMRATGDAYYDAVNLMDLRVVSTLGLTDRDITELSALPDIETVEPGYMADVLCGEGENQKVLHVESLQDRLNQVVVAEGRRPEQSGECFLDADFMSTRGYQIGDTLEFIAGDAKTDTAAENGIAAADTTEGSGAAPAAGTSVKTTAADTEKTETTEAESDTESDLSDLSIDSSIDLDADMDLDLEEEIDTGADSGTSFRTNTYTIVGCGSSAEYLSYSRGSSSLGNGEVSGFVFILPEDFDSKAYTVAYLTVKGAPGLTAYSKEYVDLVEQAQHEVEAIEDMQCEARLEEVTAEANETLADAKEKIADGEQKLEQAVKDLADGKAEAESELEEARDKLESGESELESGRQELADSRQELIDAKDQIGAGETQLISKTQELESGKAALASGAAQLESAETKLEQGQAEYDAKAAAAQKELKTGESELAAAQKKIDQGRKQYNEKKARLEASAATVAEQKAVLNTSQAEYDAGAAALAEGETAYASQAAALEQAKAEYESGMTQLEPLRQMNEALPGQIQAAQTAADAASQAESQAQAAYDEARAAADAAQSSLDAAVADAAAKQAAADALRSANESLQGQIDGNMAQIQSLQGQQQSQAAELDASAAQKQEELSALEDIPENQEQRNQLQAEIDSLVSQKNDIMAQLQNQIDGLNQSNTDLQSQMAGNSSSLANADAESAAASAQAASCQESLLAASAGLEEKTALLSEKQQSRAGAEAALTQLQQSAAALPTQIQQLESGLNAAKTQLDQGTQALGAARTELDTKTAVLAQAKQQLDAGWQQLSAADAQIQEGQQQLAAAKAELDAGQKTINDNKAKLEAGKQELAAAREKLVTGWQELGDGKSTLEASRQQLVSGESQLSQGWQTLEDSRAQVSEGEQKLSEAEETIAENEQKLKDGWQDYQDGKQTADEQIQDADDKIAEARQKLADAKAKIADGEAEIAKIEKPKWYVSDRSVLSEYSGYGENADRMTNIGQVFPVLFFLVAALISLTTMTRMVEEERTQIGTMKALGYRKWDIASKYLKYALYATLGGSVFGMLVGEKILPFIIINAYGIMYHHIPEIVIPYNWQFGLMAAGASLVCTLGAALSACVHELNSTPAVLMRPPTPKEGKRVFLEYLPFIWRRLGFTWKSTVRNLLRYKKRFLMTVIGIGGCMGLLLVGFGLRDSIMDVALIQYGQLQLYDEMVILDSDSSEQDKEQLLGTLAADERLGESCRTYAQRITVTNGKKEYTPYLYVPESAEALEDFCIFRSRITEETYKLTDNGAVVTEKLATMLDLKVGDEITINDDDLGRIAIPITAIVENYLYHYVYLTPDCYEKYYGKPVEFNSILLKDAENYDGDDQSIGTDLLSETAVLNVTYTSTMAGQLDDMLGSLDIVIVVLIVSAGMLAFVVLYNLNNININERKRELATIKVLGFYDNEVDAYVYRENILLTIIGAMLGILFGIILHRYIITTVEVDACMFGRNIKLISFVYGTLFTFGFSIFVNMVMHFKLKKIDMVESLKSVE